MYRVDILPLLVGDLQIGAFKIKLDLWENQAGWINFGGWLSYLHTFSLFDLATLIMTTV